MSRFDPGIFSVRLSESTGANSKDVAKGEIVDDLT